MKKIYIIIGMFLMANVSIAQLIITTQAELNALSSTSVIYPDLIITTLPAQDSSSMVTDLSPLMGVDSIMGNLEIRHTALTNLSGLSNIKYVPEVRIYENTELKSLATLDGPQRTNVLKIYNNPYLTEASDFVYAKLIYSLQIYKNHRLRALNILLDSIQTSEFGTSVSVYENPMLVDFVLKDPNKILSSFVLDSNVVLESIFIGESSDSLVMLTIAKSDSLKEIKGFSKIRFIGFVTVSKNKSLSSLCFLKQIINKEGFAMLKVGNNAPGANTEAEIMATDCSNFNTGINELPYQKLSLYPNPAHHEVFVDVPNQLTPYQIYDMSGKVVQQGNIGSNGRIGLDTVSDGMYILLVGDKRSKLVIQ